MNRNSYNNPLNEISTGTKRKLIVIGVVLLVFIILRPWVVIGPGQRGVVNNFGAVQPVVLNEGIHFRVPIMQEVIPIDVKINKIVTDAASASRDLQDVTMSVALNYHIIPEKANTVYQSIGTEYKTRIIDPAIQEIMKAVSALYSAEELITKRPAVSAEMQKTLTTRLLRNNIAVDAFSIVSFNFSDICSKSSLSSSILVVFLFDERDSFTKSK